MMRLATNDSAVQVLGDEQLRAIACELVKTVRAVTCQEVRLSPRDAQRDQCEWKMHSAQGLDIGSDFPRPNASTGGMLVKPSVAV
jgi:hypothetical protein